MSVKVAIACQGGGLHAAFTAGVLKQLLGEIDKKEVELVALSGTSAGALCAAMVWYGLVTKGTAEAIAKLDKLWTEDFAAQRSQEHLFNTTVVNLFRSQDLGLMPGIKITPYYPFFEWQEVQLKLMGLRPEFVDYVIMLRKHIDFDQPDQVIKFENLDHQSEANLRLLVGAVEVLGGTFKAFDSYADEITPNAIRASGVIPWWGIRPIKVGEAVYWDGLLSQNPPLKNFFLENGKKLDVAQKPDEIWVIRINPQTRQREPTAVIDIEDRRNELTGNLSLNHEIRSIQRITEWLRAGVLTDERYKPVDVRCIGMSDQFSQALDVASKLDRSPLAIATLMEHGEARGQAFLKAWRARGKTKVAAKAMKAFECDQNGMVQVRLPLQES